jgi:transcriptional regulator with XRE-family HTH domain
VNKKQQILIRFGKNVRSERIKRGISQEQLGELARVHRTYIGMIERAEKNITLSNIEKIAKALGVRPGHLID